MALRARGLQQLCSIFGNNLATVLSLRGLNSYDIAKYITYHSLVKENKIYYLYKISLLTNFTSYLTICARGMVYINVFRLTWMY